MSLASELVATIRTQIAELARARAAIAGARNSIAEVLMEVEQQTDGTSDPRPAEAITRYQVGLEALEAAEKEIGASEKALEAYVAHLLGSSATGGGYPGSPSPSGSAPPRPASSKSRPRDVSYRPERAEALQEKVGLSGCYAQIYDDTGTPISDVYRAREEDPVPDLDNIREDKRTGYSVTWHAEGHAASKMRTTVDGDVVIYQTKQMCTYDNGCRENLERVIPEGRSLYIKQIRGPKKLPKERRVGGTEEWLN